MARRITPRQGLVGGLAALALGAVVLGSAGLGGGTPFAVAVAQAQASPTPGPRGAADGQRFDNFVNKLAANLGTDTQKLRDALIKTEQQLVDDRVAAGRLTADQANALKARIQQSGGRPFGFGGPGREGRVGGQPGQAGPHDRFLNSAAAALGLAPDQLATRLRQGQSLNQIAQELKLDPAAVKQKLLTAWQAQIDQAVAAGRLPADRAAQIKAMLGQRIDRLMDRQLGGGGSFQRGPRAPAPSATPKP